MLQIFRQHLPFRRGFRKKVLQLLRNPTGRSRSVFLVGNGRSGTTMMVSRLGCLVDVDLYNENHPAAFDSYFLRSFDRIEALISRSYAAVVLFKPIKDTYRSAQILANFPHGKILFMFREFQDVIISARRKFYEEPASRGEKELREIIPPVDAWMRDGFSAYAAAPPPPETRSRIRALYRQDLNLASKIALHWLFQNRLYFDLGLSGNRRVRLVHYESVLEDPEACMRDVCDFIGIPFRAPAAENIGPARAGKRAELEIDSAVAEACRVLYRDLCRAYENHA